MTSAGLYRYGREEGRWDYFYNKDKKSTQIFYRAGMYDSAYISWNENGTIQEEGTYKEGLKIGSWKYFDSTGLLKYESRFSADTEFVVYAADNKNKPLVVNGNGEFKSFYANGKIQEQGIVENFCRKGIWKSFYENGAPEMTVFWSDNRKKIINCWKKDGSLMVNNGNGTYLLTTENDTLLLKGEYKDSLQSGEWNYYFPENGAIFKTALFENGLLNGPTKLYYDSSKLSCEGAYNNDMKDGEWIWYHENGEVSSKVSFSKDKKQGQQFHYNSNGKKIREENYENGNLISEKDFI
jgi:antitoxin component YwqK of YwqJK toxin-antitoxin module